MPDFVDGIIQMVDCVWDFFRGSARHDSDESRESRNFIVFVFLAVLFFAIAVTIGFVVIRLYWPR